MRIVFKLLGRVMAHNDHKEEEGPSDIQKDTFQTSPAVVNKRIGMGMGMIRASYEDGDNNEKIDDYLDTDEKDLKQDAHEDSKYIIGLDSN